MNLKNIKKALLLLVYAFFCALMLKITLQYYPINFDVAFLRIKQNYIHLTHYKIAFYIHVTSSIFSLLAGFTQFSSTLRKNKPRLHKFFGYIYIITVLVFSAPSGFLIGVYANGGLSSQVAFCLLSVLWFYYTFNSVLALKNKDFQKHEKFMIRSFALTLSAITLRLWKLIIVLLFMPKPIDAYQIVAWLGWVLNLVIAEIIIRKTILK